MKKQDVKKEPSPFKVNYQIFYNRILLDGTISVDLKLYCDDKDWRASLTSLMYTGVVIGNLTIGMLGDYIGRKNS